MVAVVVGADMCDYYWKLHVGLMREAPTLRTACAFNWSPVGVCAAAGVSRPLRYAVRPHTSAYRRCSSGPREAGHLGIWAGGTWGNENGPPGGTWRGGRCRALDTVLLGEPSVQIPNYSEKCVGPPYNHKRAVLNGYKIRIRISTNRERLWSD